MFVQALSLIEAALQRGCFVKFLMDNFSNPRQEVENRMDDLQDKYEDELKIKIQNAKGKGRQHDKIYMNEEWCVTGSFNMSQEARVVNSESGIVTNIKHFIDDAKDHFDYCFDD